MTKPLSQLNDGDFFMMGGDIYKLHDTGHHSRPNTLTIARLTTPDNDMIPNFGQLFDEILTVSENTEVTPGTVKFTLDFEPS